MNNVAQRHQAGTALGVWLCAFGLVAHAATVPVVSLTNTTVRVMAANLNGDAQSYQDFALRIFQGLKPDIVAIQEFNYLNNTAGDFRSMLNTAFGTNFVYFRESGYAIPNGIISRWPIAASGSWEDADTGVNDRGFAWARIDLPGTNELYVLSVHLKASSSDASRRAAEATQIKNLIQANFPANAWIVVAGDFNTQSRSETALNTFKTFLSDDAIPTDAEAGGDADTNEPRNKPYDYVLPSYTFSTNLVPAVIGARRFTNGLVFDSRLYPSLGDVAPVQDGDSGLAQHMAVLKDFRVSYAVTNLINVPPPVLTLHPGRVMRWQGPSQLTYRVLSGTNLSQWTVLGTCTSTTTNYAHTLPPPGPVGTFHRVVFP